MARGAKLPPLRFRKGRGAGMIGCMKNRTLTVVLLAFLLAAIGLQGQDKAAPAKKAAESAVTPAALIDINHASAEELKKLPGIGDAYSAAIIKNRPYANKTQLNSRKVIPAATYQKISAMIIAKQ